MEIPFKWKLAQLIVSWSLRRESGFWRREPNSLSKRPSRSWMISMRTSRVRGKTVLMSLQITGHRLEQTFQPSITLPSRMVMMMPMRESSCLLKSSKNTARKCRRTWLRNMSLQFICSQTRSSPSRGSKRQCWATTHWSSQVLALHHFLLRRYQVWLSSFWRISTCTWDLSQSSAS